LKNNYIIFTVLYGHKLEAETSGFQTILVKLSFLEALILIVVIEIIIYIPLHGFLETVK